MRWSDITAIAEALFDKFPDVDPAAVRFTDLHNWVLDLDDFDDDRTRGGEKVLEAIQQAWIDEAQ
jgi:FeS assembly protein IscX